MLTDDYWVGKLGTRAILPEHHVYLALGTLGFPVLHLSPRGFQLQLTPGLLASFVQFQAAFKVK